VDLEAAYNRQTAKIEHLESKLKAAVDHAATMEYCAMNSVPFEVMQNELHMCKKCNYQNTQFCTPDNCPLIPKAKP
jgi:hypothetical protein